MAYVSPTASTFKARFPEFAALGDTYVDLLLAEARQSTDAEWYNQDDRAPAEMYLAAHKAAGEGRLIDASGGGINTTGPIKRRKVGDVETEFAGLSGGSGDGSGNNNPYLSTSYGRSYWELLRRNVTSIFAV